MEGVFNQNRYVLDAYRIYRWRIHHLSTEVAKLHSFYIRKLVDGVCRVDHFRVGGHETINVGPDFQTIRIQGSSKDGSRVVRTSTAQVGHFTRVVVFRNKTGNYSDRAFRLRIVAHRHEVLEFFFHQLVGQAAHQHVAFLLLLCLDEIQSVVATGTGNHRGDDIRRDALAITHDGIGRLLRQIADQIHALVNALQVVQ